jgi:hypothetical protein
MNVSMWTKVLSWQLGEWFDQLCLLLLQMLNIFLNSYFEGSDCHITKNNGNRGILFTIEMSKATVISARIVTVKGQKFQPHRAVTFFTCMAWKCGC